MKKYIIKASGNINDVIDQIKALQAIFGEGATLSQIDALTKYNKLKIARNNQLKDGKTI